MTFTGNSKARLKFGTQSRTYTFTNSSKSNLQNVQFKLFHISIHNEKNPPSDMYMYVQYMQYFQPHPKYKTKNENENENDEYIM